MRLKKIDFTKIIVRGTEWFSNLALLNLCWLLFSLPILTIIPATDAVFDVVHEWETLGKTTTVFQHFKTAFKKNIKNSYKLGLPILIGLIVVIIDLYIISQIDLPSAWFQIFKYAFYTFVFLLVLSVLYVYPLMKQMGETPIRLFVVALLMAIGHPLTTLGVIVTLVALIVIYSIWPSMLFFFGMSSVAWIMTKAILSIHEKRKEKQPI